MNVSIDTFNQYAHSLSNFVTVPNQDAADHLVAAQHSVDELRMYPVSPFDLSRGFRSFEDCDDPDAVLSVWQKTIEQPGRFSADSLRRQARVALISIGTKAPFSGNLDTSDFPELYDSTRDSISRIGNGQKKFAEFAFRIIRADLMREMSTIYRGYNFNPLQKHEALANGKSALEIVGYPKGIMGEIKLGTLALIDIMTPASDKNRYA